MIDDVAGGSCGRRRTSEAGSMLGVEVHEHGLAKALHRSGRLVPELALRRRELEKAVEAACRGFCRTMEKDASLDDAP